MNVRSPAYQQRGFSRHSGREIGAPCFPSPRPLRLAQSIHTSDGSVHRPPRESSVRSAMYVAARSHQGSQAPVGAACLAAPRRRPDMPLPMNHGVIGSVSLCVPTGSLAQVTSPKVCSVLLTELFRLLRSMFSFVPFGSGRTWFGLRPSAFGLFFQPCCSVSCSSWRAATRRSTRPTWLRPESTAIRLLWPPTRHSWRP
jgi:hypothetical protein